jgi:hypothetical protein
MKWLRLYNDTPNDPKWRLIALDSGQPVYAVLAVWTCMLVNANSGKERGTLEGWDDRIVGAGLDLRGEAVAAIRQAMQGVVLDGDKLTGWDKRQRDGDDAAERKRKERDRRKNTPPSGGGSGNGAGHSGNGTVAGQTENVTRHSANVTRQDEHVTRQSHGVAENPLLSDSLVTVNPLTQSSDADASGAAPGGKPELLEFIDGHPPPEPTGVVVPMPLPAELSPETRLFNECLRWLAKKTNKHPDSLRRVIGKWKSRHQPEPVLAVFLRAFTEDPFDPIAWIEFHLNHPAGARHVHHLPVARPERRDSSSAVLDKYITGGN